MKKALTYIAIICLPLLSIAQTGNNRLLEEYLELFSEKEDYSSDENEILETLQYYIENKINLNDTENNNLTDLFFVEQFHINAIRSYIQQYGQMLSINELYLINRIDSTTASLMLPFVKVEKVKPEQKTSFHDMVKDGKHSIIIGSKTILEKSKGYIDSTYLGSPWRLYFKYQYKYKDKLLLSFSGDKDPGEELFKGTQKQGFDHYGFSLMINDIGIVKRLVIGNYNIQLGQGLCIWNSSGLNFWVNSNAQKHGRTIKNAGAFTESNYLKGIASEIRIAPKISLTAFASYSKRDASFEYNNDNDIIYHSFYTSGYHRTTNEYSKKDNITETIGGGSLKYQSNNLSIALNGYYQHLSDSIIPKENFYNQHYFKGQSNYNMTLDISYLYRNILFFGETAFDCNLSNASIIGSQIHLHNSTLTTYYRHYAIDYQNMYANALGQNSGVQNEQGLASMLSCRLPRNIIATASIDVFKFP